MSHMTSTTAHVAITTITNDGTRTVHSTENWFTTYVDARRTVARYIADNGLRRDAYGDSAPLFRDGVRIGHYSITLT